MCVIRSFSHGPTKGLVKVEFRGCYQLAFFRAERGNWIDRIIGWFSRGPFSHVELLLPPVGMGADEQPSDSVLTIGFSASGKDGAGVRMKYFHPTDPTAWVIVPLPPLHHGYDALRFALGELGCKYDWWGIIRFILPVRASKTKWFCSEIVAAFLQRAGLMDGNLDPSLLSPTDVYECMVAKAPPTEK